MDTNIDPISEGKIPPLNADNSSRKKHVDHEVTKEPPFHNPTEAAKKCWKQVQANFNEAVRKISNKESD